jgi:hypothetical protein
MQFNALGPAGSAYLRPSVILQGRIFRLGADVKW